MAESLFRIEGLRASYPDSARKPLIGAAPRIEVLKGIDLEIETGDVLGIVGGSGSGKSTLGRAMLRLIPVDSGTIRFRGREIASLEESDLRPLRRRMQMIFQDPMSSLNPRHAVRRIIEGPLRLHGFDDPRGRVAKALEDVGLPRRLESRFPHELSGGQRQRVGIARAIAMEPEFILADEIVSGLDASSQVVVLNLLRGLVERLSLTLAFVSHDLSVVSALCSKVMVMNHGEAVEQGPTARIFENPETEYARELLSAIPLPDPKQDF